MKKAAVFCLSLILVLCTVIPVFGDTYELDPFTGEIIGTQEGSELNTAQARLSSNCVYDKAEAMFIYSTSLSAGTNVYCSVYTGEMTTDTVELSIGDSAQVDVYLNGEALEAQSSYELEDEGYYTVRDRSTDTEITSFIIIRKVTGKVKSYNIPKIYFLTSATVDEEVAAESGASAVSFTKEGEYKISYSSSAAGIAKTLRFTVDSTAPVLEIEGVENGYASGPVTLGETEDGAQLLILRDGEKINYSSVLKTAGDYVITYTDEAGNSNTYAFTIRVYFDLSAWMVILAVAVIAMLVVGYMIYSRKHMRTF